MDIPPYPCAFIWCQGVICILNDRHGYVENVIAAHPTDIKKIKVCKMKQKKKKKKLTTSAYSIWPKLNSTLPYLLEISITIALGGKIQDIDTTPSLLQRGHKTLSRPDFTLIWSGSPTQILTPCCWRCG